MCIVRSCNIRETWHHTAEQMRPGLKRTWLSPLNPSNGSLNNKVRHFATDYLLVLILCIMLNSWADHKLIKALSAPWHFTLSCAWQVTKHADCQRLCLKVQVGILNNKHFWRNKQLAHRAVKLKLLTKWLIYVILERWGHILVNNQTLHLHSSEVFPHSVRDSCHEGKFWYQKDLTSVDLLKQTKKPQHNKTI